MPANYQWLVTLIVAPQTCNMLFHPAHNSDHLRVEHRMQYIGSGPDENSCHMPKHNSVQEQEHIITNSTT